jgi:hypothetical protein
MTTKKAAAPTAKKSPLKMTAAPGKKIAKSAAKTKVKAVPQPAAKKAKKVHKIKVVRDSFTMPQSEYQKIADIKAICLKARMHVKKSEVLRAGLKILAGLNVAQLKIALNSLEKIKTGRPKKH